MRYEEPVYRPPSEADSLIIQATVGCPHNRCRFCDMYKNKRFRIRKLEDILQDIEQAGQFYNPDYVHSLFLADGNTVIMRTVQLLEILRKSREVFPNLKRITSYGASRYIALKSLDEWKELHQAGLNRIHCGMETGHDPLLEKVGKGNSMQDHIQAGQRVRAAGIELSMYYLAGLGGMEMWEEHARDSAKVLNAINPEFIRIRTFTPMPTTPMGQDFLNGTFQLMQPHDVLYELRLFIEHLEAKSRFYSDHMLNFANINGILPQDKERMLRDIDDALSLPRSAFREVGISSQNRL